MLNSLYYILKPRAEIKVINLAPFWFTCFVRPMLRVAESPAMQRANISSARVACSLLSRINFRKTVHLNGFLVSQIELPFSVKKEELCRCQTDTQTHC